MIRYLIIFLLFISNITFSQKGEVDARLVERLGQSKAEEIYSMRPDYYNFLIFEMNKGVEIINKSEVNGSIKNNSLIKKNIKPDEDLTKIDFRSLNIEPLKNHEQYFQLKNNKVLKIKSQMSIKEAFLKTGMQNSKSIAY